MDNFFYEANATFAWTKSCVAGQDRIGFSIVTEEDEAVVIDGAATDEWAAAAPVNTVGPHDDSTRFYIGVNEGSQTYSGWFNFLFSFSIFSLSCSFKEQQNRQVI